MPYDFVSDMAYYEQTYASVRRSLGIPEAGEDPGPDPHEPHGGWHNPQNHLLPPHIPSDHHHDSPAVDAVRDYIVHPPQGGDDDLSRFFHDLGGRASGYETQVPNLVPQLVTFLEGVNVSGAAKELRDQWIAKLESLSGHVRDATSLVDAPPDPELPGQQKAPWTTCGKGWFGVAAGTFGIAASIVVIVDSGGTATPVAIPFATKSGELVAASLSILGENGCSIGALW